MWLGTGFVKGFALVLLLGVLFSMFTAIILTRVLLDATIGSWAERHLFLLVPKRKRYEAEKTKESPTLVS